MDCTDENIIHLLHLANSRSENQAVQCLMKCERQAISVIAKQGNRQQIDYESVFRHAIVEFIIKVRKNLFELTGEAMICTYLTRIAIFKAMEFRKELEHNPPTEIEQPDNSEATKELIAKALAKLNPSDQEILTAFYFYGISLKVYADQKGLSYDTVKKRISRAREKMEVVLKKINK